MWENRKRRAAERRRIAGAGIPERGARGGLRDSRGARRSPKTPPLGRCYLPWSSLDPIDLLGSDLPTPLPVTPPLLSPLYPPLYPRWRCPPPRQRCRSFHSPGSALTKSCPCRQRLIAWTPLLTNKAPESHRQSPHRSARPSSEGLTTESRSRQHQTKGSGFGCCGYSRSLWVKLTEILRA